MDKLLLDAYFAGLIDGEGNVAIYKLSGGNVRPVIKVDMTCEATINALHAHFGGYKGTKKIKDNPTHKPQWRWEVTFAKAIEVAKRIEPFLITKKSNALELLAFVPKKPGRQKGYKVPPSVC